MAYWRQDATGEVGRRLNDPSGESDNVGETRRWGYDLQVNLHPNERTEMWMSYSWQYSKILEPAAHCPTAKARKRPRAAPPVEHRHQLPGHPCPATERLSERPDQLLPGA